MVCPQRCFSLPHITLQLKRKYICKFEDFTMINFHVEHIYLFLFKYFNVILPMQPTTHSNKILMLQTVVWKLSIHSKLIFNDVSCVGIIQTSVKCVVTILCGLLHLIIGLHVFSIIGGKMTTTFTMKQQIIIIHVCKNPFNHVCIRNDWEPR